jgi:cell division protein FtsB
VSGGLRQIKTQSPVIRMKKVTSGVLIALTIVLLYFALAGTHGYFRLQRGKGQALALQRKTDTLDKEMRELRKRISAIQNEPDALEKKAREDVGFAKPGETVYIFPTRKTD